MQVIRTYLDAGGTLLDTGDFYGAGHNEELIRRALQGRDRDRVVLSVKFGAMRGPGGIPGGIDAGPRAVQNFLAYSLQRLGVDHGDVYRPARLDPAVPIEDTIGAIADLVDKGYVRHIGLSEVGTATIRRAAAVAPISDLQIEYSLPSRDLEDTILPVCRELGTGISAHQQRDVGRHHPSPSTCPAPPTHGGCPPEAASASRWPCCGVVVPGNRPAWTFHTHTAPQRAEARPDARQRKLPVFFSWLSNGMDAPAR